MIKSYIRFIALILVIFFSIVSALYIPAFYQTKVIESKSIRFKVANLIVTSKFNNFWQGQMYKDRYEVMKIEQSLRVEYFVAILYTLTDELQNNGEATLTFYEVVPAEDRIPLYNKLNELEKTKYFENLESHQQEYIHSIKEIIKLSSNMTNQAD